VDAPNGIEAKLDGRVLRDVLRERLAQLAAEVDRTSRDLPEGIEGQEEAPPSWICRRAAVQEIGFTVMSRMVRHELGRRRGRS
jgi:hypothetical protein